MNAKPFCGTFTIFILGLLLATSVRAQQLYTFSGQSGNSSWFSADNWFTNDPTTMALKHANSIPGPADTAKITGGANAAANTIRLNGLILVPNATVTGGDFVVSAVQMFGGIGGGSTSFNGSVIDVLVEMDVFGGSCAVNTSTLGIDLGATCFLGTTGAGQLTCSQSQVINDGEIVLYPSAGSALTGGTNLINHAGATILGGSNGVVSGVNFDNSGTVRMDSGAMQLTFNSWSSASGLGKFKTTTTNAIITVNGLIIPPGITNIFSGPGITTIPNGATMQGTALVGVLDSTGTQLDPGTLQFGGQIGGTGVVHVVALPGNPSVLLANPNVGGSLTGLVVNVDVGGQFNIGYNSTGNGLTLFGATINNAGTMTWSGKGGITFTGNAVVNNLLGALFDSQATNTSTDGTLGNGAPPGGGAFNNFGTFRKSAGTNAIMLAFDFNNSGLLDVQTGQAQIYGGASSGTFNAAPGTELRFGSGSGRTNYFNVGAQFNGTNVVRVISSPTVVINGNITLPYFSLEGGTLDGPGNLTVSNAFNFSGSTTIQGVGTITIPAGGLFNVMGSGTIVQRTINNSGSTLMTNGFVGVGTNATFNNLAGALLEIRNGGGFGFPNPPPIPHPVLNNFGTIRTVNPGLSPIAFDIVNQGTVLVLSNQLNSYVYQQLAGITTVSSNATLNPQGLLVQGGTVNGSGTVSGSSAQGFIVSGGIMSPGNPFGILNMASGAYTQTVAGALSITIAGTNAGSQFSRLAVSSAIINGALNVSFTNGFQPALGDVYYIVSTPFFGSVTGNFSALNGLHAANGIVLVPVYQGFGISLIAATDPVMTSSTRTGNQFTFSFPTTTGLSNVVEYSDSLSPPLWKPLSTNSGNGNIKQATDPFATNSSRFYRVRFK